MEKYKEIYRKKEQKCSPCVCVALPQALRLPPTVQKDILDIWGIELITLTCRNVHVSVCGSDFVSCNRLVTCLGCTRLCPTLAGTDSGNPVTPQGKKMDG